MHPCPVRNKLQELHEPPARSRRMTFLLGVLPMGPTLPRQKVNRCLHGTGVKRRFCLSFQHSPRHWTSAATGHYTGPAQEHPPCLNLCITHLTLCVSTSMSRIHEWCTVCAPAKPLALHTGLQLDVIAVQHRPALSVILLPSQVHKGHRPSHLLHHPCAVRSSSLC